MQENPKQNTKGKFIVFYGANNTGKSTQAKLLVDNLLQNGYPAEYIKYPLYDLKPTGPIINEYLRGGNPYRLTAREAQILYVLNRQHFEPTLKKLLNHGVNVIAECYIGTGLSWGEAAGVERNFLRHINSHLLPEDLAFLLEGKRFKESMEREHRHENDFNLIGRAEKIFSELADEMGWIRIDSTGSIHEKEKKIFEYVIEYIKNINSPHSVPSFTHWHKQFPPAGLTETDNTIKITRLSPLAQLPRAKNGYVYNLFSHDYYSINPGESIAVSTGIVLALPSEYVALVKSDLGNFSFIIDSNHNHEIKIHWINITNDVYHIAPGQKIGQLMFQRLAKPNNIIT